METTINQRINLLFENSGEKSIRSYALKRGIAPSTLNECIKGSEPRYSLLLQIINGEPDISYEWLLTGKGDMLKSNFISTSLEKHTDVSEITSLLNRNLELEKKVSYLEGQNHVLREQLYIYIHGDEKKRREECIVIDFLTINQIV